MLCGERISCVQDGVGGTELGRGIGSFGACKFNDANVCVPCNEMAKLSKKGEKKKKSTF